MKKNVSPVKDLVIDCRILPKDFGTQLRVIGTLDDSQLL